MSKTIEIRANDRGFGVYADGAYKGTHKTEKKARRFAALLTGERKIDLRAEMLKSEASSEAYTFAKR